MLAVRELREKANLTQKELADKCGIGATAVAKWEAGVAMPTVSKLPAVADALGCSVDELLGYSGRRRRNAGKKKVAGRESTGG